MSAVAAFKEWISVFALHSLAKVSLSFWFTLLLAVLAASINIIKAFNLLFVAHRITKATP